MILDLENFVRRERPLWEELDAALNRMEAAPAGRMPLDQARRLYYLYERASAALAQIRTFSSDPDLRRYVESLVARAYAAINSADRPARRFRPVRWFVVTFPQTFRANSKAFAMSVAVTLAGILFGAGAMLFDADSKPVLIGDFGHLAGDPAERVRQEEQSSGDRLGEGKSAFASMLMTHNIQVSMLVMALGLTWGVGTLVVLFANGVILGAVAADYVRAGCGEFLAGWLLPHGSIEIPAILIAGQAGLLLASVLIGRGERLGLKARLKNAMPTLVTLIFGVAVLLVWAGIIEAFFSQYHYPVVPYWVKIAFGSVQLAALAAFLTFSGRRAEPLENGE